MSEIGTITTTESEADIVVEWKIENFLTLPETDNAYYNSPNFSFSGEEWYLRIFPNGSSRNDWTCESSGHVNLELCKYTYDHSIRQSFSLSLKTAKGEKYNEEHFMKDFDHNNDFHEFNRFVPRSELTRRRSELMPEGFLTVVCTMMSSTSAGNVTGNDPELAYVGASTRRLRASTRRLRAHTRRLGAFTQRMRSPIQRVRASTQTVEASTQTVEEKYEAAASGSSTNSQEKKALHDFKELFLKKEDCDVTIKVKSSKFPAHRVILKARSPVLASTFRHDMKESATGVLEIDDCDPSSFSDFLCFLYCADVQLITQKSVSDLFTLADKYHVLDLRSKCLEFMKNNLTVDTFCETFTLALRHSETDLIKLSTDYFTKNAPKIIVTVKWQTFITENPIEGNELFIKILVPNTN